jgi:hypothetical protein
MHLELITSWREHVRELMSVTAHQNCRIMSNMAEEYDGSADQGYQDTHTA